MKKITYYIIDDNIAIVKSLEKIIKLRELGNVCGCCTDPEEALEEILEERPDIVLVDLLMGGMDGITLMDRVKERIPEISFVMVSKVTDKEMVQQAYTAGVEFFIHKPVNLVEVETVLRNVADRIKMREVMGSLQDIFQEQPSPAPRTKPADTTSVETLLGMLGMLGEKGVQDIRCLYRMMQQEGGSFHKDLLARVAEEEEDTVKNVEPRIRRAIRKGLANAAEAGLDDYGSELFTVYAGYVFDFKTLKDEMNYARGKAHSGGRVSISRFMEGLELYRKSL
jgi:two-component system response regulator YcbB